MSHAQQRGYPLRLLLLSATLLWLALPAPAQASTDKWQVCVYNFADLNQPTLASMHLELTKLLHNRRVSFDQGPCAPAHDQTIHVVVRKGAAAAEQPTLGRAPLRGGRILPVLEVYVEPLVELMGHIRSSAAVGRALARIAAHELHHYIRQDQTHAEYGLMRRAFSGSELAADDSHPFLNR